MTDTPIDQAPESGDSGEQLDALTAYAESGWRISSGPPWTASRRRGAKTQVLGARDARGLLEHLMEADAVDSKLSQEQEPGRGPGRRVEPSPDGPQAT